MIRDLRPEDYDALIALWRVAGLSFRPMGRDRKEKVLNELKKPNAIFLVAEQDGDIIGSVLGTHDGRKGWINRLAVSPIHQRRGIASKLIDEVEQRLGKLGIDIIAALVEDWNITSMEVFAKLGYVKDLKLVYLSKRRSAET